MKVDLARPSDALYILLCAYLMTRFTLYFTEADVPQDSEQGAMQVASVAFGTSVVLSLTSALFSTGSFNVMTQRMFIGLLDSSLPALGAYIAVLGYKLAFAMDMRKLNSENILYSNVASTFSRKAEKPSEITSIDENLSGFIGFLLFFGNTLLQIPVVGFPCIFGSAAGSINAGLKFGTVHLMRNILLGSILGCMSAVFLTVALSLVFAVVLGSMSLMFGYGKADVAWLNFGRDNFFVLNAE